MVKNFAATLGDDVIHYSYCAGLQVRVRVALVKEISKGLNHMSVENRPSKLLIQVCYTWFRGVE